jgi:aromatic ring-opening dioxygenase catalytic subunit (LigB family)
MGEIVGGVGVPHTPHFPGIVDRGEPLAAELRRLYGTVAGHLSDMNPDVIIFFTCDHYNIFFVESLPIFSIGVAPAARGPSDYRELQQYEIPIASGLARHIQAHAVRSGFDVGMSQEFEFDHPVTVPLHFLTPAMQIPVIPVFIGGLMPPLPPAWRCHGLGAVIREAVTRLPDGMRVAGIASGSFSLEIGGPRISAHSHTGVPDVEWAGRVLSLMGSGQVDTLVAEAGEEQLTHAGNAAGELLTWIALLGMLGAQDAGDARTPVFLECQRDFGHAYGAWRARPATPASGSQVPAGRRHG